MLYNSIFKFNDLVTCSLGGLLVKEMLAKGLADGAAPHHRCAQRARCRPNLRQAPTCKVTNAAIPTPPTGILGIITACEVLMKLHMRPRYQ